MKKIIRSIVAAVLCLIFTFNASAGRFIYTFYPDIVGDPLKAGSWGIFWVDDLWVSYGFIQPEDLNYLGIWITRPANPIKNYPGNTPVYFTQVKYPYEGILWVDPIDGHFLTYDPILRPARPVITLKSTFGSTYYAYIEAQSCYGQYTNWPPREVPFVWGKWKITYDPNYDDAILMREFHLVSGR